MKKRPKSFMTQQMEKRPTVGKIGDRITLVVMFLFFVFLLLLCIYGR